jgi:hypothetical protein
MPDRPPAPADLDLLRQRRLNRATSIAAAFAGAAALLLAFSSSHPKLEPTASVEAPVLPPPPLPDLRYRLADDGLLMEEGGAKLQPTKEIAGHVDVVKLEGDTATISGWAVDTAARRPAQRVVILIDGRSVSSAAPGEPRPDVAKALSIPAAAKSGYARPIPLPAGRDPRQLPVRVFAVQETGAARELAYPPSYPFKRD